MTIIAFVRRFWLLFVLAVLDSFIISPSVYAQTSGYAVGEPAATAGAAANPASAQPDDSTAGPVRLARFSYIQGAVTWRADDGLAWSGASINQPLRQGAQIVAGAGARAEIQLDDGSYLRLGNGAIVELQLLFSDSEGEFTQIKLTNGLVSLRLKHNRSVYQVDTPLVSVKADGPARLRIGISDGVEVGLREGAAVVEGARGKVTMHGGDYLDLRNESSNYDLRDLPPTDSWERWNDEQDEMLDSAEQSLERHQVPPDVAIVAGNLDAYGTWQTDVSYGQVWCPRTIDSSWRPYYAGHWVWVNPFGWTWCSDEPWGWAPYHYGAWFHGVYGWAWRPGPANQYWSPAVVHFTECNGSIAWCALSPGEIQYPALISVGVLGGNWTNYFSIGAAGCYYPDGSGYCVGRAFSTFNANRSASAVQGIAASVANGGTFSLARPFVPVNAKSAAGVTVSTEAAFVGRGPYTPMIAGSTALFSKGKMVATPPVGRAAAFGPRGVKPTTAALTPLRGYFTSYVDTSGAEVRPVFHSVVPKEPVQTGIIATSNGSGAARVARGITGASNVGSNSGSGGRTYGSAADAAAAARTSLNGGRVGGNAPSGSTSTGSGYVAGRSTGGGSAAGGTATGAGSAVGRSTTGGATGSTTSGGSSSGAGSSAGHTSGGTTAGGGYHVGGGTPAGGSPARR